MWVLIVRLQCSLLPLTSSPARWSRMHRSLFAGEIGLLASWRSPYETPNYNYLSSVVSIVLQLLEIFTYTSLLTNLCWIQPFCWLVWGFRFGCSLHNTNQDCFLYSRLLIRKCVYPPLPLPFHSTSLVLFSSQSEYLHHKGGQNNRVS